MPARHVVDAVAAAACGAPFQPTELRRQPGHIEQLHLPAIQQRQGVSVYFPFWLV